MNLKKWSTLAIAAALFGTACDPYDDENDGEPQIVAVTSTSGSGGDATFGTGAGSTWAVNAIPSSCSFADGAAFAAQPIFFVTFNKQMDAASIQTSPQDCTPAGDWLTVEPAAPAGMKWFSCYTPSSPTSAEGGSAIIFLGLAEPADVAACSEATPPPSGWDHAESAEAAPTAVTAYRITGQVLDKGGRALSVDITANFDPDPAENVRNLTVSASTADSVTLSWLDRSCADPADPATKYVLRRADADGEFTINVAEFPIGTQTFTVTGLTAGTAESFELFTVTTPAGATEPLEAAKGAIADVVPGLGAPPAPTLAFTPIGQSGVFGSVTVTIPSAAVGASTHDVYRKTAATGAYARQANSTMATDVLTSEDRTVAGNTRYIYKVVPVNADGGRGVDSPETTVFTPPARPSAATVLGATDTSITIEWSVPGNVTPTTGNLTWVIERAPSVAGVAGDYAAVTSTATFDAADRLIILEDTGLAPSTTYFYRITFTNVAGSSPVSAGSTASTVELATPVATLSGATLTWAAVPGATSYTVQRSLSDACGFEDVGTVTATTFTDPAPVAGAFYTVTATSATGTSAPSAPVPPAT